MIAADDKDHDADDRPWRPASSGASHLYVLPCQGEDILKLGISRDPLNRLQSLHQRYYEFFDLDRAFLVETDSVEEARRLELALGRELEQHGAPAPLMVPVSAGGHTEWYRGALRRLLFEADDLESHGHVVHRSVRDWLRPRLTERAGLLFHWSSRMLESIQLTEVSTASPIESARLRRTLRNALDAYAALGLDFSGYVPAEVERWHAELPGHG
jgi:hypothetical protein